jgi:cobalamin synthase
MATFVDGDRVSSVVPLAIVPLWISVAAPAHRSLAVVVSVFISILLRRRVARSLGQKLSK